MVIVKLPIHSQQEAPMQTNTLEKEHIVEENATNNVVEINSASTAQNQKQPENVAEETTYRHKMYPSVFRAIKCGNVALVGPAGCGKTTLAEQCAQELGVPFFFTGAINSEYKLTGFMDAQGRLVRTVFREAFENGGLFLFDEIDGSLPSAVLSFNSALANGYMDFPDRCVPKHRNFYAIAAANTYWNGATREYVGRNQLDGATLDRFLFVTMDYDEALEAQIASDPVWTNYVQRVRREVQNLKLRAIISPRASILGSKLLEAGASEKEVCAQALWKGLDQTQIDKIVKVVGKFKKGTTKDIIPLTEVPSTLKILENQLLEYQIKFLEENPGVVRQHDKTTSEEKIKAYRMWIFQEAKVKVSPSSSSFRKLSWDIRKNTDNSYSLWAPLKLDDTDGEKTEFKLKLKA